tara:strand:+ start:315 stop:614 length:300 start_codon:yes stop_codon:yes gene_type:complete
VTKKKADKKIATDSNPAKANRRRKIDPTTCERDYSSEEREFMTALDEYKRNQGRMFPTCSEILEVIRGLGYVQQDDGVQVSRTGTDSLVHEAEMNSTSL